MTKQEKLVDFLRARLELYYSQVKATGSSDDKETRYINGIMAAARIMDILSREELEKMITHAHFSVFGMSLKERKIDEALEEGGEHWEFFESPAIKRK